MDKRRMLLIFNPTAGQQAFVKKLFEVLDRLTSAGFLVTTYPTQGKRDAFRAALAEGANYEYIVCSGGDGTFSEVADAALKLKSERRPILGYIPSGTANDFAGAMGIPTDAVLAAEAICRGTASPIDVGRFGDAHFSYVAAFGLFTDVSYGTPQDLKNMLGHAAYMLEGVKRLANIKSWEMTLNCGGEEISGEFIFGMVTNSPSVGGFKLPMEPVEQGDGMFRLILAKKINRFSQIPETLSAIADGSLPENRFITRDVRNLSVKMEGEADWSLDGEYGGRHGSVEITVLPGALTLMRPL